MKEVSLHTPLVSLVLKAMHNFLFVLRSDTTDATATVTTNNSAAGQAYRTVVPNNSTVIAFHGTLVAREDASDGTDCAAWKVEGLIRREASASTTTLVSYGYCHKQYTTSWGMALSADTTNGALKVQATGDLSEHSLGRKYPNLRN